MPEELIIRHCSPTLAGIKTGNLFSCTFESKEELFGDIRAINRKLVPKGIRMIPLRLSKGRALIYLYRPTKLFNDLASAAAAAILEDLGYSQIGSTACIAQLSRRLQASAGFPHEIGLFLGYPPEDVCGFIENKAACAKCTGCWKVYGDEEQAQKTFEKYKKCTLIYCSQWAEGKSIERLTVAD
ncbi:DUF3793 family protein [Diplocloster agilis]|uniref:DUF3793 family protein n=1 Tax=Diplocloster agilis TaxID=2850323 RepID=A0A949K3K6_9FIRM|nr:DUF3793 family protein [Diplocloster agilis]MBU9738732.1 DUF3793 family protein [Diplocloster agilis]